MVEKFIASLAAMVLALCLGAIAFLIFHGSDAIRACHARGGELFSAANGRRVCISEKDFTR